MQNKINVKMQLTNGDVISLELYPDIAPETVDNFVKLCKSGFYDGVCFHRVIPGFMVQGGGFVADGKGLIDKPSAKTIKGEFASNGVPNPLRHTAGVISMARTQVPDSASSQFFICVADTPFLDGAYASFGKVTDDASLKNAIKISTVPTHSWMYYDDIPNTPVVIKSVTVL